MNILPKKSWHVRTKKNIERVRRDEALAAEEEKNLKRRIQLAEQEARTELLRKRAKGDYVKSDCPEAAIQHVNFFQEIEDAGRFTGGVNKEHEEEEKAIKEKFEKNIGLLTYLGQSSAEAKGETPWYLKSTIKNITSSNEEENETASSKQKSLYDPLNDMEKYLSVMKKKHGEKELFIFKNDKEDKKHKEETKKEAPKKDKMSKIEELRAKRLQRESEERKRSQKFLENLRNGSAESEAEVILNDRSRKYNSQFNPHLARSNNTSAKSYQ